jgi:hypothetical protein
LGDTECPVTRRSGSASCTRSRTALTTIGVAYYRHGMMVQRVLS